MTDLRTIERDSIRAFVQSAADEGYLSGRVLDYACGKQPYRDIVEAAGGEYHGFDRADFPANVSGEDVGSIEWVVHDRDAVLCTQVVQYLPLAGKVQFDDQSGPTLIRPLEDGLERFHWILRNKPGHLVLTYPTNWPEVEPEDLHRFTKAGMERLLTEAGFEIVRHEERAYILGEGGNGHFALGYGVIARA